MKGILTGLGITFRHFIGKKTVTWYPFEIRERPPRSRGLIKLVRDESTGRFNCEACLFCEKICPPQCITIQYQPATDWRPRRLLMKNGVWGNFKRPVRSLLSREGRPQKYAGEAPLPEEMVSAAEAIVAAATPGHAGLVGALQDLQGAVGYLPRPTLERLATENDVPLSDVYGAATSHSGLRLAPENGEAIAVCACPSCYAAGMGAVAGAIREELGAAADRLLREEDLCGAGDLLAGAAGPVLKVDGQTYHGVDPEAARQIVRGRGLAGGVRR